MKLKYPYLALLLCVAGANSANAESEIDELLDLPLDELFYVASKSYESFEDAPGVVSIVKRSQIERFGAKNLADVLNYATGFNVSSKLFFRNSTSSVRSVNRRMLDGHTLILVNGRPMRDNIAGSINSPIYSGFPIHIIDHVEVVRGPGSVLYGSNAYSAVVNIVTEKPKTEKPSGLAVVTAGTDFSRGLEVNAKQQQDDMSLLLAGKFYQSDGWDYTGQNTAGNPVAADLFEKDKSIYGNFSKGAFNFQGFQSKRKDLHINALSTNPAFVTHETGRTFADMGYTFDIDSSKKLDVNLTYNELFTGNIYNFEGDGQSYLFETNYHDKINKKIDFLLGATAEYREARNITVVGDYSKDFSWFSQASYKTDFDGKFIFGLQANRANMQAWDYSPRIAYNQKLYDNWGFKTSYGKAFRTPSLLELYSTSIGAETLDPEVVRTVDLQFYYRDSSTYAALTFYNTRQENPIAGPGGGAPYVNGPTTVHRGIEFETTHYINDEHYVEGSFTWQRSKDENSVEGWGWAPSFMAKAGYSYQPYHKYYDVGVYAHYYSDATRIDDLNSNYDPINPNPSSYTWLTAKSKVGLWKMFNLPEDKVYLELLAENLLDSKVYSTTATLARYNSNLTRPGRTLFATLHISF